jgi:RNA recognition motif. (a.k.a. RRM, RBD, or RNP domain)
MLLYHSLSRALNFNVFRSNKESDDELALIEEVWNENSNNPDNRIFLEGPTSTDANENRSICLRNVPNKLKQNAIESMLSKFGKVVSVTIPQNQERFKEYKDGFVIAFAEFSTFR